jgi:hypothetical protein
MLIMPVAIRPFEEPATGKHPAFPEDSYSGVDLKGSKAPGKKT